MICDMQKLYFVEFSTVRLMYCSNGLKCFVHEEIKMNLSMLMLGDSECIVLIKYFLKCV